MSDLFNITDFLQPLHLAAIAQDGEYHDGQIGRDIAVYENGFPDLLETDIVLLSCTEQRGEGPVKKTYSADTIRHEFYKLYNWHAGIKLADIGEVRIGATLGDTYAALRTVLKEINAIGKTAVVIGGSHDLTLAQYQAFADRGKLIEAVTVDARMDLDMNSMARADNFLMEMLTGEPNFVRHYSHIGFQSYLVHPNMLQTLDKLRFDCFRVGKVRENMEEVEPAIRNADLLSFDLAAIAHSYAPCTRVSPNGFSGDEACALMRYAGQSQVNRSVGIYGYHAEADPHQLSAKQISQMLWYFLEGRNRASREPDIQHKDAFNQFHIAFGEVDTTFLQSKHTGRWWMQLPDQRFIACTYTDYLLASGNEIPERWLRAQERSV